MGAADAWHEVLASLELHKLKDQHYCGGVADIAKFFDQIVREIVICLAEAAGMPKNVLTAYTSFLQNLKVHNILAGGVGMPYQRRCGIPQGCPMSMTMVALIMRPWIMLMRENGVQTYILADDVLILAKGPNMLHNFAKALNQTHDYLQQMGAKIAPDKSFNFASCSKAQKWLTETLWTHIKTRIEVTRDF